VASAGVLLLTTVVALTIGLIVLGRTQRETDRQRRHALEAERKEKESARIANEQRALARETLKTVVEDIQGQLKNQEDRQEPLDRERIRRLRQELLNLAITGLGRLARTAGTAPEEDLNLIRANLDLGDILFLAGKVVEARKRYEKAREVADRLVRAAPRDPEARLVLCFALSKLGDVHMSGKRYQGAGQLYEQALRLSEALAREERLSPRMQHNLYVSFVKVGDAHKVQGNHPEAVTAYGQALSVARTLEQLGVAGARRDLSAAYSRLGEARFQMGDMAGAVKAHTQALEIDKGLFEKDRHSARARRDLSLSYDRLAGVHRKRNDVDAALWAYRQSHKHALELTRSDPNNMVFQTDLVETYRSLGEAHQKAYDQVEARDSYEKAVVILRKLQKEGKLRDRPHLVKQIGVLENRMEECKTALRAVEDLAFVLALPADRARPLLITRAHTLLRRGKHAEAAITADRLAVLNPKSAENLYDAGCCYALCERAVGRNAKPADWSPEERHLKEEYARRALASLHRAWEAGFFAESAHVKRLREDGDLDSIRGREEFRKWLRLVQARPKGPGA
jgi:tetratricopeptide (TPR) repeat protein